MHLSPSTLHKKVSRDMEKTVGVLNRMLKSTPVEKIHMNMKDMTKCFENLQVRYFPTLSHKIPKVCTHILTKAKLRPSDPCCIYNITNTSSQINTEAMTNVMGLQGPALTATEEEIDSEMDQLDAEFNIDLKHQLASSSQAMPALPEPVKDDLQARIAALRGR